MVDVTAAGDLPAGEPEYLYYLKDALGSVGALVNNVGTVVERYVYDPYGQTTIIDPRGTFGDVDSDTDADLFDFAAFQQCFTESGVPYEAACDLFDSDWDLDVDLTDFAVFSAAIAGGQFPTPIPQSAFGNPFAFTGQRYEPATGLYQFWARTYSPDLGRFLQTDMQGVLLLVDVSLGSGGFAPCVSAPAAEAGDEYADALMLYLYVAANPVNRLDPFGLDIWDEWIDNQIDDLTGHKLYALGAINEGAKWASLGLRTAADIALSLIPGYGVYEAYQAAVEIRHGGRGGLMNYLQIGLAGFSTGYTAFKAVKLIGRAIKWGRQARRIARTALKFRAFTKSNFRHNLKLRTGMDPPSNVHAHHVLPDEFRQDFAARGINHNDPKFGAWWPGGKHLQAHRAGYNQRWRRFLDGNPRAKEILEFGRRIAREYGLDIDF
jgi:RHS repeat-associated protein